MKRTQLGTRSARLGEDAGSVLIPDYGMGGFSIQVGFGLPAVAPTPARQVPNLDKNPAFHYTLTHYIMKPLSGTTSWGVCPGRLKSDFLSRNTDLITLI